MRILRLLFCSVVLVGAMAAQSPSPTAWANDPQVESKIDALLKQMTLDEKVGQLITYSQGAATGPGTGRSDYQEMVAQGKLGSIFNLTGANQTNEMQKIAVEKSRLHIPLLFGLDVIHGFRTEFPVPLGMSATWDPALVEQAAHIAAKEASHAGVRWTYSPMVDIARDARWGRIVEGAGEDPYLGSAMAAAYVRGYQGAQLGPRVDCVVQQALCRLRRGRSRSRLQYRRDPGAAVAAGIPAAVPGYGRRGRRDLHERL